MSNKYFQTPFAASGNKTSIEEQAQADGTVSYEDGYGPDYEKSPLETDAKFIDRGQMNALFHEITGNLKTWQEQGYYSYNSAIVYNAGGRCNYDDGAGLKAYVSVANHNTAVPAVNGVVQKEWRLANDSGSAGRILAVRNMDFYVSPAGDDLNDGLTTATPKKTFSAIVNLMTCNYDFQSYAVGINLAAGVYTGETLFINNDLFVNAGNIYVQGAGVDQTIISANSDRGDGTYTIRTGIEVRGRRGIHGCYVTGIGFENNRNHIYCQYDARLFLGKIRFGNIQNETGSSIIGGYFVGLVTGSTLSFYQTEGTNANITIDGDCYGVFLMQSYVYAYFSSVTFQFVGNCTFKYFFYTLLYSYVHLTTTFSWSGTAPTGSRGKIHRYAHLNTSNQGEVIIPGTSALTVEGSTAGILDDNLDAYSAQRLATARTIALTGDVIGTVSFDGSANAMITTTSTLPDIHNGTEEPAEDLGKIGDLYIMYQ